jgi:hypothetical protein
MVMRDSPVSWITWWIRRNFIAAIPVICPSNSGALERLTTNHPTVVN